MGTADFARKEFALRGWDKPETDEMQKMICANIIEICEKFDGQGHSGSSANYAISMLNRVLRYKPISPLTGEESEWHECGLSRGGEVPVFQNVRDSEVFKEGKDGKAYWMCGRVFRDPKGFTFTNRDSRVNIEFPWVHPDKPEIVDVVPADPEPMEEPVMGKPEVQDAPVGEEPPVNDAQG